MKVLIVGSLGMLGTDLLQAYGQKHDVVGMDVAELDITDAAQCDKRLREIEPGLVINAAALTDVDFCESHEEEAFSVNGRGVGNLAAAAASIGSFLVHYSTDYVFDGRKQEAYREEDTPNPESIYGKSKLRGEELVRSQCKDHLVLRISWLFGRKGKNFVSTIIKAAVGKRSLRVVHDQRGSPCFSRDIAAHTLMMTERRCRGVYHLTNSGSCTWYELALEALHWSRLDGVPVEAVATAEFPRPAPRPANSVLNNARLEREGLPLLRDWRQAVREYVLEMNQSPDGAIGQ